MNLQRTSDVRAGESATSLAFLDLPGEMAALMREKDWAQTPFGPIEKWSPALRSAVGICVGSRFPIVVEDDPALRMLVLETLADLGYRADEAADAKAAICTASGMAAGWSGSIMNCGLHERGA